MASARRWFRKASEAGMQPDKMTFGILMSAAAKAGDLVTAEVWYDKALKAGFEPDIYTFTAMIDGAARQGDLNSAEHWLRQAHAVGINVNAVVNRVLTNFAAKKAFSAVISKAAGRG